MNYAKTLRFVSVVTMIVFSLTVSAQIRQVKTPDFAFPQTVSADARRSLHKALHDGNAQGVLRSLIDYTLAQSSTGADHLRECIVLIDSVSDTGVINGDPVLHGMLDMLKAVIYNNVYIRERWKYDNRVSMSLLPLPEDYTEWSGEQFRYRIIDLLDNALADSVALRAVPLKRYNDVVTQDHMTAVYYPTIYHFAARQAIDILRNFDRGEHIFASWIAKESANSLLPFRAPAFSRDSIGERILAIYGSVIDGSQRGSAPAVNGRLERLEFLQNHTADNMMRSSYSGRGELLKELYSSYLSADGRPMTEYAGDILLEIPVYDTDRRELYDMMTAFLNACPGYWRKDCIRQTLRNMEQKTVSVSAPRVVAPGVETAIDVNLNNVSRMTVEIYDVSSAPVDIEDFTFTTGMAGVIKVASLPVNVTGESVPFDVKRKVSYTFAKSGNYIAVPAMAGASVRRNSFTKIHVTKIALAATTWLGRNLWAVDAENGAPLTGVSVSINPAPYRQGSVAKKVGLTDSIGSLKVSDKNGVAIAALGADKYAMPLYLYNYNYDRPDEWIMHAQGYPSLALYHPGDSMEWVAICYEYKGGLNRPYDNKEVTSVLYDANRMPIDTLKLFTDRFGRVSGGFRIPSDGLTGRFMIAVDDTRNALSFEVSDYKLPSFRILQPKVEQDAPAKGDMTVRGHVETYAGFPLSDAGVTLSLSVTQRPRWWYPSPSFNVCTLSAQTDAAGDFEIVIDKDVFATSPLVGGYYTADISVLSSTGETQTASVSFGRSERYVIKVSVPNEFDLNRVAMPIEARVVNYEDSPVAGGVDVELVRKDSVSVMRTRIDNKGTLSITGLGQGTYRLIMSRENADTVTREIVLYDHNAAESPCPDDLIWAPEWRVTVGEHRENSWLYAANCDTHLLVTLWNADGIISQRWEKARKGFNRISVTLPDGVDDATLSFMATGGYRQQTGDINVTRADSERGLRIIAESFRDRIVPGEQETWTLRIVDLCGNGREAAVITDMYNTALDALAKTVWSFLPSKGYMPGFRSSLSNLSSVADFYLSVPADTTPRLKCPQQVIPEFDTYGRSWNSYMFGRMMVRGLATSKKMAMTEDKLEDEAEVVEEVAYDMAAAGAGPVMMNSADKGMALAESAVVSSEDSLEADAAEGRAESGETFAYRESEIPLAFFRPSIVTDKDGRVALSFTVPDANTTWGVRVLAVTDSLLSATFARDVVASKDIMVKPNLPRFVRNGDRAVVQASVMNATDAVQYVDTEVEIFNPADNSNLLTFHHPDTIAPGGNCTVEVEFNVPAGMSFIGYRIKSSTATRADGEQSLIPVLPSVTPVIDTYPFYMGTDRHEMSMRMPDLPKSGRVTLQFCENPAWYVVTALPGLLNNESSTAPDAARAIYSASIARGLMRDNPAIAEALREWSDSDRSSQMLASMLERNAELKTVLLGATPWMLDARNDTERMTRLALLFDRKLVDKTINDNIALLSKLSSKGGGWSWCASYPERSGWATRSVLEYLGRLVRLGFLPDDSRLSSMIGDALRWDTSVTREEYRKYPDGDYSRYVYLHDLFVGAKLSTPDAAIVNSVTQHILRDWKNVSLASKAVDAQILYRHDHRGMAGQILASIRQFAETGSEKGMWFPSLDDVWYGSMDKVAITALILETFHMIDPGCSDVDLLRQWLILQKGAQNWGAGTTASYVVGAVLSTSSSWIAPAQGATVRMGRMRIEPKDYERMTGEFEVAIPVDKVSGQTLKIDRRADSPSWGAVYCQYESDMTDVKPVACPELSIHKSIPDSACVGDRVTIRMTLKADADMDYVVITDDRPACYEPVEQLPGPVYAEGLRFYRENLDSSTRIFIDRLPKGTYILTYDVWVNNAGQYTSGIATAQSQYAPQFNAHSGGKVIISDFAASR